MTSPPAWLLRTHFRQVAGQTHGWNTVQLPSKFKLTARLIPPTVRIRSHRVLGMCLYHVHHTKIFTFWQAFSHLLSGQGRTFWGLRRTGSCCRGTLGRFKLTFTFCVLIGIMAGHPFYFLVSPDQGRFPSLEFICMPQPAPGHPFSHGWRVHCSLFGPLTYCCH